MNLNDGNIGASQDGAATVPSPDEEFDAAFDEAVGSATDTPGQGFGADHDQQGADAPPAPAFAGATPPAAAPAPDQANPQDDLWSQADPALRAAHESALRDMQLRFDGARGRASGQERELTQLRQELAALKAAGNGSQAQPQGQTEPDQGGQHTPPLDPDALKQLREDYPEVAGPLLDVIAGLQQEVGALKAPVGALQQQQKSAALSAQESILADQHPDWQQVTADDRFAGWLHNQPTSIKEALQRNFDAIVDGADAALVIGKFKADLGIAAPAQENPAAPAPQTPSVMDRRARQIAAGRDAGRNGPAAATGIPDDFDAAFDVFSAKRAAQR